GRPFQHPGEPERGERRHLVGGRSPTHQQRQHSVKRISAILVGVVALALGATTYAAVIRSHAKHARVTQRPVMLITSQVSGTLYPGSVRPVKLRIKNLLGRKVKLLGVIVKVHKPSGSCP